MTGGRPGSPIRPAKVPCLAVRDASVEDERRVRRPPPDAIAPRHTSLPEDDLRTGCTCNDREANDDDGGNQNETNRHQPSLGVLRRQSRTLAQATDPQPGSGFEPGCRVSTRVALPSKLAVLVERRTRIESSAVSAEHSRTPRSRNLVSLSEPGCVSLETPGASMQTRDPGLEKKARIEGSGHRGRLAEANRIGDCRFKL